LSSPRFFSHFFVFQTKPGSQRLERLPADLSPPGVAAVHDVVRHQEEGLQELHCPAQDVGQPVQYTIFGSVADPDPNPDPLVIGMDPDPDPSFTKQKK
jgi:hypothetical protein